MTATNMNLRELPEKTADTDFPREMIGFTAQRLMELEVETLTGADAGTYCASSWAIARLRGNLAPPYADGLRPGLGQHQPRR